MTFTVFKPMLAGKAPEDLSTLTYPLIVSPKLDGIRCLRYFGQAVSRTLKLIPNDYIRAQLNEYQIPDGFDGELLLRDKTALFKDVSSAVMSRSGEPDFVYAVFDWATAEPSGFSSRLESVHQTWLANIKAWPHVEIVEHRQVNSADELLKLHVAWLEMGYEGTMIRSLHGPYKQGRSTTREGYLLKLKNFVDEEAEVIGVEEMMHNTNEATLDELGHTKRSSAKAGKVGKGTLGKFLCRFLSDGTEFKCGTGLGLTDEVRKEIWDAVIDPLDSDVIGSIIKVKHQPDPGGRQEGQAPRIPIFLGFRDMEIDE